jgi:hypothetical protein
MFLVFVGNSNQAEVCKTFAGVVKFIQLVNRIDENCPILIVSRQMRRQETAGEFVKDWENGKRAKREYENSFKLDSDENERKIDQPGGRFFNRCI